jgi:hypothetical protein
MHYSRRNKLHNFEDLKLHNIWMKISISRGFANWDQMCWSLDCTTGKYETDSTTFSLVRLMCIDSSSLILSV